MRDRGDLVFLTATSLKAAMAAGECPVSANTEVFARFVLLFAALLPDDERRELVVAAAELGCSFLASAVRPQPENASGLVCVSEETEKTGSRLDRPRLALLPPSSHTDEWKPSAELVALVSSFLAATARSLSAQELASDHFRVGVASFIQGAEEDWNAAVTLVEDARSLGAEAAQLRNNVLRCTQELHAQIMEAVGWPEGPSSDRLLGTDQAMADELLEAGRLASAIEATSPSAELTEKWRNGISDRPSPGDILELAALAQAEAGAKRELQLFREAVGHYARNVDRIQLTSLLINISRAELGALLPDMRDSPWIIGGAILLRATIDAEGARLPRDLGSCCRSGKQTVGVPCCNS